MEAMNAAWDYKRQGYESAVKVIRRLWPLRNHPGVDRMQLRRAIAQAARCSRG